MQGIDQQLGGGVESSRNNARFRSFSGLILLLAAVVVGLQLAYREDWGRLAGVVILFGMPGILLLWSGLGELLQNHESYRWLLFD